MSPNLRFEFLATWPGAILAAGSQRVPLYAPRPGWGGGVTFAARRGHLRGLGHNVRVFRGPLTEKSKLASMLVIWSPRGARVPMAWGGYVGAAGYPMGCQIGRLARRETPLARPSQATKISKPNRFAYPFRSRPRGVGRPPVLDLPPAKTSSYRDTANLGSGVTPRGGRPRAAGCQSRWAPEVKRPLDIYLQRHSALLPELWLHYSRLSARYTSRRVPGAY